MVRLVNEYEVPTGEPWPEAGPTGLELINGFELIKKISEQGMSREINIEVDAALKIIVERLERDILCDTTQTTDGNQK